MLKLYQVQARKGKLSTTIYAVAKDSLEAYNEVIKSLRDVKAETEDAKERKKLFYDHDNVLIREIPFAVPHSLITENTFS